MDPAESSFPCACRGKGSFRLGPRYPAGPVEGLTADDYVWMDRFFEFVMFSA